MSTQAALFDAREAKRLKELGMWSARHNREQVLMDAQNIAFNLARMRGEISIDDVYSHMEEFGLHPEILGPAAGSVFCGKSLWEFTGRWVKSKRTTNHGRMIRVWRLK